MVESEKISDEEASGCPRTSRAVSRTSSNTRQIKVTVIPRTRAVDYANRRACPAPTVGDCSRRALVARIQRHWRPRPTWLLVGIGDDAASVEPAAQSRRGAEPSTPSSKACIRSRVLASPTPIGHARWPST